MLLSTLLGLGFCSSAARAVTIYGQIPLGQTSTGSAPQGLPTNAPTAGNSSVLNAAYDNTILNPPAFPDNVNLQVAINVQANNASVQGISIMQHGSFYGFSVETSVVTQLMGKNSSHIQPVFLNLISQIVQRAGGLHIRMGGNTQDFAYLVDHIDNGHATSKEQSDAKNPTKTPSVLYSIDFFYLASNISSLVPGVGWYLGIPFNDTNWRFEIAQHGQSILGSNLLGLQAGNEPDYYGTHGHRDINYSPQDYFTEFGTMVNALKANNDVPIKNMLIGPSLATGPWQPQQVWDTGYLDAYKDVLEALSVEHYPSNNCFVTYGVGSYTNPQDTFPQFLTHQAGLTLVKDYLDSSAKAQALGKPFIMFETNSATCGGLPGISDSFGATLWALDYGFTMAASNFSHALLHFGGQNVYYNPITAPPTNQSAFNQYTVGGTFYSIIVTAEAFGKSNVSQIVDTTTADYAPSYAIYDNGQLDKVAFFNYMTDNTGAHDITGTFTVQGGTVPQTVYVKYLAAQSVSVKTNITWANQTFGNAFHVDGNLKGDLNIVQVQCDTGANACHIPVKAPGFALVFLKNPAVDTTGPTTYATTAYTKAINTATVDPSVLATSNGHSAKERLQLGSTSYGSQNGATSSKFIPGLAVLGAMVGGALVLGGMR